MPPRESNSQERESLLDESSRSEGHFAFTPEQFSKLVDPKSPDLLKQYGGTKKILEGLRVDPAVGLSSDEGLDSNNPKSKPFQQRQKVFGRNVSLTQSKYIY